MTCRHCGKEITYGWSTGWRHTTTLSMWCDAAGLKQAEPKRIQVVR